MAKRTIPPEPRSAQEKSSSTRQLKVRKGHYDYQLIRHPRRPYAPLPVPWVQIKGYWLDKAGFSVGTGIKVTVSQGKIVLEAE
ncbi:MAG: hypothetical protein COA42_12060 [Alteromonadaceae bacterium]|nr:MAG: hypothetical protein COA42_12060 [Alteromonadaceae bacterium]